MRDFSLHSGERVPALRLDDVPIDHVSRYEFAASYLADKKYRFGLDCFCGSGYGAAILGERLAANVVGIDGSLEAVHEASRRIGNSNIMYAQKCFPFSLPAARTDFIVSMESLEHVEDDIAFARVLSGALVPAGTLIVSAPNGQVIPIVPNSGHWHYRHYAPHEVISLFSDFGLEFKFLLSSDANVREGAQCKTLNLFSPIKGRLRRDDDTGDTCIYVFEKPL